MPKKRRNREKRDKNTKNHDFLLNFAYDLPPNAVNDKT